MAGGSGRNASSKLAFLKMRSSLDPINPKRPI